MIAYERSYMQYSNILQPIRGIGREGGGRMRMRRGVASLGNERSKACLVGVRGGGGGRGGGGSEVYRHTHLLFTLLG